MTGSQAGVKVEHGAHPETSSIVFMYIFCMYTVSVTIVSLELKGMCHKIFHLSIIFFRRTCSTCIIEFEDVQPPAGSHVFFLQARPDLRHG
jgi:hypothetical protein